jgi:alpha-tubulin suppressor-like RCC1 family protein
MVDAPALGTTSVSGSYGGEPLNVHFTTATGTRGRCGIPAVRRLRYTGAVFALTAPSTVSIGNPGRLWAWGYNGEGQLGTSTAGFSYPSPQQIGTATDWTQISAGGHVLALKSDGSLWAWGYNGSGQLGIGSAQFGAHPDPVRVGTDTDWAQISAGNEHSTAIKHNGTLWAWGRNAEGELGDGTTIDRSSPVQIGTDTDWAHVEAGENTTVALKTNGTLWVWGNNQGGQLGLGTCCTYANPTPTQLGTDTDWVQASTDYYNMAAIKTDGTLWVWGDNLYGQLGDGTTIPHWIPQQLDNATDWRHVDVAGGYILALKTNDTLWAWGANQYGELGIGTDTGPQTCGVNPCSTSPIQVGTAHWSQITANGQALAIASDGTLWAWGPDNESQIGDSSTNNRVSPTQLGPKTWTTATAGAGFSLALATS